MKKFTFEANKRQWEKPTEPCQKHVAPARVTVCAETKAQATKLAKEALREKYLGSGTILGELKFVGTTELAVDWNYGYGDKRGKGTAKDKAALYAGNK
jgi:hypothetical protein